MRNRFVRLLTLALSMLTLALLPACGGGGGGGGGSSTPTVPSSYTGSTQQAAITSSNAQQLTVDALNGGLAGPSGLLMSAAPSGLAASAPFLLRLPGELEAVVLRSLPGHAAPATSASLPITGSCGGQAVLNVDVNTSTGAFTGTLTFTGYCEDGTTVTGSAPCTGTVDLATQTLSQMTMTLSGLTVTDSTTGASQSMTGTITLSGSSDGLTVTADATLVLKDLASGVTYWADNFHIVSVTDATTNATDDTARGRFYDPAYGYVDFSTPTPLHIAANATAPTSGVILFTGSNGSQARLTVNANGSYLIEVDANGDGTFESSTTYTP